MVELISNKYSYQNHILTHMMIWVLWLLQCALKLLRFVNKRVFFNNVTCGLTLVSYKLVEYAYVSSKDMENSLKDMDSFNYQRLHNSFRKY